MKRLIIIALALLPSLLILNFGGVSSAATAKAPAPGVCSSVAGSSKDQVLQGTGQVGTGADCNGTGVTKLASAIVGILSLVVGIAAVIVVIIAGFKYITSGGDAGKITNAKTTLVYAIVGLVVAALAQFLVHFVLNATTTTITCPAGKTLTSSGTCK